MTHAPPTDPPAVLLDLEDWATHRMFDACDPLTDSQLDHEFEMGLGTLRRTLVHNINAMVGDQVLNATPPDFTPEITEGNPTIDRLREAHVQAMAAFRDAVSAGPFRSPRPERKERRTVHSGRDPACHDPFDAPSGPVPEHADTSWRCSLRAASSSGWSHTLPRIH